MRKLFFILFTILLLQINNAFSSTVYFFWGKSCIHCKKEKIFLEKIQKKYPDVTIEYLEIEKNKANRELFNKVVNELDIKIPTLPLTVIEDKYFIGFFNEKTTGKDIENAILEHRNAKEKDLIKEIKKNSKKDVKKKDEYPIDIIKIPLIGSINIKNLSLPLITVLFAAIDGFNPCAMWVLVMLISFLLPMQNRKKIFILAGFFILVSGFVYFMFMVAWLNIILFFAYLRWIKIAIGAVAILGGIFYLKEFFFNKENECKVTSSKLKHKISEKLYNITENKRIIFAILGVSILAFFVNLIEFFCSAGLPVVYTQILSLSVLSKFHYYLYIILYIFIFMLDDFFIFSIAVFSLQLMRFTAKYAKFSHLIGGIVLLILGILLIFKPELLIFS